MVIEEIGGLATGHLLHPAALPVIDIGSQGVLTFSHLNKSVILIIDEGPAVLGDSVTVGVVTIRRRERPAEASEGLDLLIDLPLAGVAIRRRPQGVAHPGEMAQAV